MGGWVEGADDERIDGTTVSDLIAMEWISSSVEAKEPKWLKS